MKPTFTLVVAFALLSHALALPVALEPVKASTDPDYDHQTSTYNSQFQAISSQDTITVRPFFSPGYSLTTVVDLIQSAESYIKIYTPSFDGWACKEDTGCSPSDCRNDTFPVFSALLNALHNGVAVSIVVNDYNSQITAGNIDVRTFLQLNGATVKYYKTTTFMHSKVVIVDGKKVAISSVNYSHNSFVNNREAGAILSGQDSLIQFVEKVYDSDASEGYTKKTQTYSSSDMATITDKSPVDVTVPTPSGHSGQYIYKPEDISVSGGVEVYTSPDYARTSLFDILDSAKSSLTIYVYQITDCGICKKLLDLQNNGVTVNLLVSRYIYGEADWKDAQSCYQTLKNAGLTVHTSAGYSYYTYSHNKYFIVDGTDLHWSTGNLSPSDYPTGDSFPAYGSSDWQRVNRDFNVHVSSADVANVFQTVYEKDLAEGGVWSSSSTWDTC